MQLIPLPHLLQDDLFRTVTTDDKVNRRESSANKRDDPRRNATNVNTLVAKMLITAYYIAAKSTPFRYTKRLSITMLIVFLGFRLDGSGVNLDGSTALGIVETLSG